MNNPDQDLRGGIEIPSMRMVGAVGADKFGPALKQSLENCGVNSDGVRIVEGQQTTVANIFINSYAKAKRIIHYSGVNHSFKPLDLMNVESLGDGVRPDLIICLSA